jgi:hypothetical protein
VALLLARFDATANLSIDAAAGEASVGQSAR